MTTVTPTTWATIQEAADHKKLSTKTIRRYIDQGLIGPRLIRVNLESLDNLGRALRMPEAS